MLLLTLAGLRHCAVIREKSRSMYSVLQKHEAGHWGWSVKLHEEIVLPVPWTGGIRTSQGPGSKHGSWVISTSFLMAVAKQTPDRNNLRNKRFLLAWSLGGISWKGGEVR